MVFEEIAGLITAPFIYGPVAKDFVPTKEYFQSSFRGQRILGFNEEVAELSEFLIVQPEVVEPETPAE